MVAASTAWRDYIPIPILSRAGIPERFSCFNNLVEFVDMLGACQLSFREMLGASRESLIA